VSSFIFKILASDLGKVTTIEFSLSERWKQILLERETANPILSLYQGEGDQVF